MPAVWVCVWESTGVVNQCTTTPLPAQSTVYTRVVPDTSEILEFAQSWYGWTLLLGAPTLSLDLTWVVIKYTDTPDTHFR